MGSEIINSSIIIIIIINHNWLFQCQSSSSSLAAPTEQAVVWNQAKNWTVQWWKQKYPNIGIAWRVGGGAGTDFDPIVRPDLQCRDWGLRRWAMFQTLHIITLWAHCDPTSSSHIATIANGSSYLGKIEILKYRNYDKDVCWDYLGQYMCLNM